MQVSSLRHIWLRMAVTVPRDFDPSFSAVAKAWTQVPQAHRDTHFFATADFDNAMGTFQKVRPVDTHTVL